MFHPLVGQGRACLVFRLGTQRMSLGPFAQVKNLKHELEETRALAEELSVALRIEQADKSKLKVGQWKPPHIHRTCSSSICAAMLLLSCLV